MIKQTLTIVMAAACLTIAACSESSPEFAVGETVVTRPGATIRYFINGAETDSGTLSSGIRVKILRIAKNQDGEYMAQVTLPGAPWFLFDEIAHPVNL